MTIARRLASVASPDHAPKGVLTVRPALPRDQQALTEFPSPPPARGPGTSPALLLVAERNHGVLGAISLAPADPTRDHLPQGWWVLRDLQVRPGSRGSGVGAALLDEAVARARLAGALAVAVHMLPSMTAAIDLGESFGFRRAPALDRWTDQRDGLAAGDRTILQGYVLRLRHPVQPVSLTPSLHAVHAPPGDRW